MRQGTLLGSLFIAICLGFHFLHIPSLAQPLHGFLYVIA
jgi:hypothetical protein